MAVAHIGLPPLCSGAQVIGKATPPLGLESDHGQPCTSGGFALPGLAR